MKTKIVEHIAGNAKWAVTQAQNEAVDMTRKYRELADAVTPGAGLDFAVLREKLDEAIKLLDLLT